MPSLLPLSALAALLALACAAATTPARTSAAVFEVLVGASDPKLGIEVQVFAPDRLFIRPGDTVVFKQTTYEIHSVTFLAGQPIPQLVIPIPGEPGALQINPIAGFPTQPSGGLFDPTKYINSGVNAGPNSWNITFPSAGVFPYLCIVHGQSMGGVIRVVNKRKMAKIPKAAAVSAKAAATVAQYIADARAQYPGIVAKVPAPTRNADNTLTHYVYLGYRAKANVMIDLNWFFPANITAKRGDTVKFLASPGNMDVPHVVGFYNGATVPQLVLVKPRTGAPPLLQVNPALVAPINPGVAVKRTQVFTSGWINPGQNATFKLGPLMTPGVLPYVCPIHLPGMVGAIRVTA